MDTKSVLSLVEQLEDNIEDLEDSLEPLLEGTLATTTKRLPLLDRAKLNALLVYSIESLLFCELVCVDVLQRPDLTPRSISSTQWSCRQRPFRLPGIDQSQAIL